MSHIFFARELEGVTTWWRIERRDGVALGFTSHDRDLYFAGLLHRAAPGILPSAIRKSASLTGDSAEMQGALAHDSIAASDLEAGRFDGAKVAIGAVDWETLEHAQLYAGSIGLVSREDGGFTADLLSAKQQLAFDPVPRTSPTCRAQFCGKGCTLSAARFTRELHAASVNHEANSVAFEGIDPAVYEYGHLRWLEGPQIGQVMEVVATLAGQLIVDQTLEPGTVGGMRASLREGCNHTLAQCQSRFGNALNFQGEPFLPGNDLLARYPAPQ